MAAKRTTAKLVAFMMRYSWGDVEEDTQQ
jgi:hypothetical protein